MKKSLAFLLLSLVACFGASAQAVVTTSVSISVTDAPDAQAWANGSYVSSLVINPGTSTATSSPGPSGTLDASGNASFTLTSENDITFPTGGKWQVTVCPSMGCTVGTSSPVKLSFTQQIPSTLGASISFPMAPPAPRLPVYTLRPTLAYGDAEITSAVLGSQYYNITSGHLRYCAALPCSANWQDIGSSSGGGSINFQQGGSALGSASTLNCTVGVTCAQTGGTATLVGLGAPVYNIKRFGAICNFSSSVADTSAIKAAVTAATATGGIVFFPAGGCVFDNSTGPYTLTNIANVTLAGEGRGSIVLFTTLANTGFFFLGTSPSTGCSGITIRDMNWQFQPNRTTRFGAYPLNIEQCTNVRLENMNFNNGNGAGVRIGNSTAVEALNTRITNFLANGFFTVNNVDLKFVNTTCVNNGDGCEEYSFFDGQAQATCHHITSTGMTSTNDNAGIIINGCQDVSVTNFTIDGAGGFGINILQDNATTTTMFPDQVEVGNGSITNTGYGTNASNTVNAPALEINIAQTPSTNQRIDLHDIHITHTAQRCLFIGDHNTVNLNAHNLWCDDNGSAVGTNGSEAIELAGGNIVKLSNITSSAAGRYSLRDDTASIVEVNHFTSINAQVGNTSTVAIRKTGTGSLVMDGVNLIDTYSSSNRAAIQNSDTTGGQFLITGITSSCTINPCGVLTGFASPATLQPPASGFGSNVTYSSAACETAFGATTLSGASTTTGLNCLPANAIIDAVVYRVTTAITTATSFTIGDSGSATRYCGTQSFLTIGATGTCTAAGYFLNATAKGVLITPSTTPGAGAIRLLVYYHTWTAPSS